MFSKYLIAATTAFALATAASSSPKRGLCYVPDPAHPNDDAIWTSTPGAQLTWYYNYKPSPSPAFAHHANLEFVPMLWGAPYGGDDGETPFLDSIRHQLAAGANITHVLGFNEPDGDFATGGSNMAPEVAAAIWTQQLEPLRPLGVKLGAPAVTGSQRGFEWLASWLEACDGGCTFDFIPVHWYGDFEGLAAHVGHVGATYPGFDIWVTEWGVVNRELRETQWIFANAVAMFDRWPAVSHYSYFGAFRADVSNVGPNSAMLTEKGELTDIGSWYLGGEATYRVPHKSRASSRSVVEWVVAAGIALGSFLNMALI